MGITVVKRNTYRLIDANSFELPLPFRFEVYKKDYHIADYEINEDGEIICNIITKYKEDMITTIHRPLTISDIHYLFSCRVFQDCTPYTYQMLKNVGVEKYNVRDIIRKTHGVIPYDNYWIKFEDDDDSLDFETVQENFRRMMEPPLMPAAPAANVPEAAMSPDLSEVLSQHTIDISGLVGQSQSAAAPDDAENMLRTAIAFTPPEEEEEVVNNKMSEAEIAALLMTTGIETPAMTDEQVNEVFAVNNTPSEPSGGMMSQEAIEAMLAANAAPDPEPSAPSGGMMSQEAIEAMLAANAAPDPEPTAPSGGMMSQEAIEAMLAANSAPDPEPSAPSGGMMSQEAIEAMLAANAAPAEEPAPEPAPAPEASGGKMSQDDIAALFAANAAPAEEPAPEPAPAPEASGGKMSQDDIAALFAANAAPAEEPAPEPAPAPEASGGKMSQDAIEALLNSMQEEVNK